MDANLSFPIWGFGYRLLKVNDLGLCLSPAGRTCWIDSVWKPLQKGLKHTFFPLLINCGARDPAQGLMP